MTLTVRAPLAGTVIGIEDVPDPVFAGRLVGPGLALEPERTGGRVTALAPVRGALIKVHPHAFVVAAEGGRAVLVHLGLDTVSLGGAGFTVHASEGESVEAGDPVISFSPERIEAEGLSPVVPVGALDAGESDLVLAPPGTALSPKMTAFTWA